jgi:hypothetical protein
MIPRTSARLFSLFTLSLLSILAVGALSPEAAQAQRTALTFRASSTGLGGDVAFGLSSHWNARVGASYFRNAGLSTTTIEDGDFDIDWTTTLFSLSAIADYFPWKSSGFHLSAGVLYNGNGATGSVISADDYTVGSRSFTPEEIGTLDADISFNALAPYAGLGFGNVLGSGSRLGLVLDLGVIYHQSPNVTLSGTGMVGPTAEQAPQLEQNLESFQLFPVLSFGLSYRLTGE